MATQIPLVAIANSDGTAYAAFDSSGRLTIVEAQPVAGGSASNLWNAIAVDAGGTSTLGNAYLFRVFSIIGNTSGASTITLQASGDAATWRDTAITLAANGDFNLDCRAIFGVPYVRLKSSAAVTITAGLLGYW